MPLLRGHLCLLVVAALFRHSIGSGGMCTGPPPEYDSDLDAPHTGGCSGESSPEHTTQNLYGTSVPFVLDITATITDDLPVWDSPHGARKAKACVRKLSMDMEAGDDCYLSEVSMVVHLGTHIDMPSHFLKTEYKSGNTVEKVDLGLLMGTALVLDVPAGANISAEVLRNLNIPPGVEKLLLKTDSTTKGLMHKTAFDSSYTGFTADGSRYLAQHTDIKTVGIDYLSIARYEELVEAHVELFKEHIMVIEGLVLDAVQPGWYTLTCLPLKLAGVEGAPARCILTNAPPEYQRQEEEEEWGYEETWSYGFGVEGYMPYQHEHEE